MHDEGPHSAPLPFVPQGAAREKAGEVKDRDTDQGGGREKVHAGEKGEQRKEKRATKPRTKQGVASSRARDARRERGHGRHTAHGGHHTAPKHRRGEHQRDKRKAAPHTTTRTAQTPQTPPTPTAVPTARGERAPAARPKGGQPGEGERLTPDAPHNGGRHPPWGRPTATPRRATPACRGARCGAGAGSPRPHRPHPGHTGRGTLAARPRGQAAGRGTAPDTRRPSQRWQATPLGDGPPPPPGHAAPTVHAGQGDSVKPPHPHTRAHSTWVADPNGPPSGRAVRGGGAPDHRRPSQQWKAPPPGTPFRHPHREQRQPARAHAVGPVLGPHACTHHTRDTRVSVPRLPAPEDGRLGEGQRLTPDAPHNGGRPSPPGTAPHQSRGMQPPQGMQAKGTVLGPHTHTPAPTARGKRTPTARPVGGAVRGGGAPDIRRPSQQWKAPPRESASAGPTASNAGPQGRTLWGWCWVPRPHRPHPGHTGRGTPAARPRGRAVGGGTAPDTRRPSQRWQASPPGDGPPPSPLHAAPTGHAGQGDSVGPPHPHTRAHSTWVADPNSPPSGRAVGGGEAPDLRRPSQQWKAPPPGMAFRHPHSEQRRPARAHAVGPVLGPQACMDHILDTRVAEPRLPAPEDRRLGEGQRLTPDAPHSGGRPPPPWTAPHHPRGMQPPLGMQAKKTVLGPHTHTFAPTACCWRTPTARPVGGQFGEGERLTTDALHNGGRQPPGNALPPPPQRAKPARKGARCGAGAGSHARTDRTRDTRVAEPRLPAPEGGRPGEGQRLTPDAPHNGGGPAPPGTAPHHPRGTQPPQGMQAKGTVMGPHTHTPAPAARR